MMGMMIPWSSHEAISLGTDGKRRRRSKTDARHNERRPQIQFTHGPQIVIPYRSCPSSLLIRAGAGAGAEDCRLLYHRSIWHGPSKPTALRTVSSSLESFCH